MNQLITELKKEIISQLNLQDITPEDIKDNAPLFVDGLGLDSIDVLELIVLLQKKYGIKVNGAEEGKSVFFSVQSMAEFIYARQQQQQQQQQEQK
ncbi:phosphopantetheine-binding protein [Cytophaga hutchinsonii]|jgi:acyl carrier protein|uniref:Acyl carrier protein n=1 Tax=Cytophaga hutchinsonii (strain ATCC 33406 / DSM 1761 / CIP 103989 / NBRC 15051 / NCIMB 9469 / D465) TaxID=269798 RepID=A0A6N4SSN7_CYTH3|nr:phosphopantetheine-binding protein [Cytophaga hutchinsonii]ABG59379.1 acyl carrier protein [Cytophaga hutchinsonii ATCC 33406]SFX92648.1 acyl carrier protein [Cytophaga hutchinsonii ATCC 33406]